MRFCGSDIYLRLFVCLCVFVYRRQAVAGTVSVWNDVAKVPWMFLKEISSDGDVSTVS